MSRLAPRLFTLCSATSFVLCVAVCALWVRGHWVMDIWLHETPWRAGSREWGLSSSIGQLNLIRSGVDNAAGWGNRYGLSGGDGRWHGRSQGASWHVFNSYSVNR